MSHSPSFVFFPSVPSKTMDISLYFLIVFHCDHFVYFLVCQFICNLYSLKLTHYFWLRYDAAWGWITSLLCRWGWSGCRLWWGPSTRVCCCRPVWAMCTGFNHPTRSWTWQHGTYGWCTQWKQLSACQSAASQYEQSSQLGNYPQVQWHPLLVLRFAVTDWLTN